MTRDLKPIARFGPLEIFEVFDYYDGPRLFACRNALGNLFLAMWVGTTEISDTYWVVAVSRDRFVSIRSGGLSLADAFVRAELGFVYICTTLRPNGYFDVYTISVHNLDRDLVPDSDEFISLPTETLPLRFADLAIDQKAIALQRDIIGLHFKFPGQREEAPTRQFGKILVSIQETIDSLGQVVEGSPTARGLIPPELLSRTETRLVQAAGGSFAVEISAAEAVDLFGRSLIGEALAELVRLVQIGDDPDRLRERLLVIRPRAATKYKSLLASLIAAGTPLKLEWAAPVNERNAAVDMSLSVARGALEIAEQVTQETGERHFGIGYFVGIELPRRTFTAILRDDETIFRGRIDDAAMQIAEHATLNKDYRLIVRETLEFTTSGEEKTKFALESIEEI